MAISDLHSREWVSLRGTAFPVRPDWLVGYPNFAEADWSKLVSRTMRTDADDKPQLDYDLNISKPISKGRGKIAPWLVWLMFRRATVGRPSLLIRGAISDLVTDSIAERMKRSNPGLQVVEVPGVGHAPTLDEPVARKVLAHFLASAP